MSLIEKKDGEGKTPLIKAALFSDLDAVQRLLEKGANVKARDSFGRTPLIAATAAGSSQLACTLDIVRLLLDHSSDINAQNHHGWTALMEVVSQRNSPRQHDLVQLLLSHSPDLSLKDKNGRTVIDLASGSIALLLKKLGAKA